MSDDPDDVQDDVDDPDVEDGEDVEPATPDDPDGPDLDDDDLVDVDEDMVAAVAGKSDDDEDDQEDVEDDDDEGEDSSPSKSPTETLTTGTSIGDMYCSALGMGATMARQTHGSGVDNRQDAMDEYGDLARQMDLDDFVNEWFEEQGGIDELSPGQAILIGTAMFSMAVVIDDPAIAENLSQEVAA